MVLAYLQLSLLHSRWGAKGSHARNESPVTHPHLLTNILQWVTWITEPLLFIFVWPCISSQIFGNNQLDALFHVFVHFISLHVSSITSLIIRRSNCINTTSGMISLCKWLLGMPVRRELQYPPERHTKHQITLIIPDDVLIQFDLLMMSTWCSEHVQRWNE